MEPMNGDRVSLDAKKVGQPRRGGVVKGISKGLSGSRYDIEWDDGSRSTIFPGAGTLLVEPKASKSKQVKAKAGEKKAKPQKAKTKR